MTVIHEFDFYKNSKSMMFLNRYQQFYNPRLNYTDEMVNNGNFALDESAEKISEFFSKLSLPKLKVNFVENRVPRLKKY